MKSIASEFDNNNDLRHWIKELTEYAPQKIDEVLRQMEDQNNLVRDRQK